ncbi:glycosyltransferase involved in cell wall biosynthesis [Bradyrhizobium sp. F1.13.1]
MAANFQSIRYSLVIPVFNEEAVLPVLLRRLDLVLSRLDGPAEAIFVDDGSSDSSSIVLQARSPRATRAFAISACREISGIRSPSPPAWTPRKVKQSSSWMPICRIRLK